jgi:hypothetical protein
MAKQRLQFKSKKLFFLFIVIDLINFSKKNSIKNKKQVKYET